MIQPKVESKAYQQDILENTNYFHKTSISNDFREHIHFEEYLAFKKKHRALFLKKLGF